MYPQTSVESGPDADDGRRFDRWLAALVPEWVARRALAVSLTTPDRVQFGRPTRFTFTIRNRLPFPLAITVPTTRLWEWSVDDAPAADRRDLGPPAQQRTVRFGPLEDRSATWTWDGRIRVSDDQWKAAPGERTVTASVAGLGDANLAAEATVEVVSGRGEK